MLNRSRESVRSFLNLSGGASERKDREDPDPVLTASASEVNSEHDATNHCHTFQQRSFRKSRRCTVCHQPINAQGSFCRVCRYACHKVCEPRASAPCKEADKGVQNETLAKSCQPPAKPAPRGKLVARRRSRDRSNTMDLGFVTQRVMALRFPPGVPTAIYRDNLREVALMLQTKHTDKYMIFNLSERRRDLTQLNSRVAEFGWPETLAPPLDKLCTICKAVDGWLSTSPEHVAVLHARANRYDRGGWDRIGVVVSAYIHYSNICSRPDQALDRFAMKKFFDDKIRHLEHPSQKRYVSYFAGLLSGLIQINSSPLSLRHLVLTGVPQMGGASATEGGASKCRLFVRVYQAMVPVWTSGIYALTEETHHTVVSPEMALQLRGDVLIKGYHCVSSAARQVVFRLQFHTCAVTEPVLNFSRQDLDDACDDMRFPLDAGVELYFAGSAPGETLMTSSPLADHSPEPIQRWNSYDSFTNNSTSWQDENDGASGEAAVVHLEGPVDGSLYATVSRKPSNGSTAAPPTPPDLPPATHPAELHTVSMDSGFSSGERERLSGESNPSPSSPDPVRSGQGVGRPEDPPPLPSPDSSEVSSAAAGPADPSEMSQEAMDVTKVTLKKQSSVVDATKLDELLSDMLGYCANIPDLRPCQTPAPDIDDIRAPSFVERWEDSVERKTTGARRSEERQESVERKMSPESSVVERQESVEGKKIEAPGFADRLECLERKTPGRLTHANESEGLWPPSLTTAAVARGSEDVVSPVEQSSRPRGAGFPSAPRSQTPDRRVFPAVVLPQRSATQEDIPYHARANSKPFSYINFGSPGGARQAPSPAGLKSCQPRPAEVDSVRDIEAVERGGYAEGSEGTSPGRINGNFATNSMESRFSPPPPILPPKRNINGAVRPPVDHQDTLRSNLSFNTNPLTSYNADTVKSYNTDTLRSSDSHTDTGTLKSTSSGGTVVPCVTSADLGSRDRWQRARSVDRTADPGWGGQTERSIVLTASPERQAHHPAVTAGDTWESIPPAAVPLQSVMTSAPPTQMTWLQKQQLKLRQRQLARIRSERAPQEAELFRELRLRQSGEDGYSSDSALVWSDTSSTTTGPQGGRTPQVEQGYLGRGNSAPVSPQLPPRTTTREVVTEYNRYNGGGGCYTLPDPAPPPVSLVRHWSETAYDRPTRPQVTARSGHRKLSESQLQYVGNNWAEYGHIDLSSAQPAAHRPAADGLLTTVNGNTSYVQRLEYSGMTRPETPGFPVPTGQPSPPQPPETPYFNQSAAGGQEQEQRSPASSQRQWLTVPPVTYPGPPQATPTSGDGSQQRSPSPSSISQLLSASTNSVESSSLSALAGLSRRSSLSSDSELVTAHPLFVRDHSRWWYKPQLGREQAIAMLKDKPPGTFVIRDSSSFPGAFGLALKVATPPAGLAPRGGDVTSELVRHFLIETTSRGVRLKGCPNEPTFGSLAALVYQHSVTSLALPCRLRLPETDPADTAPVVTSSPGQLRHRTLLETGAACTVLYLCTCDTEALTGPQAVRRAASQLLTGHVTPELIPVHFKVSNQGITLTDSQRKQFFRRHYNTSLVSHCSLDPEDRRWTGQAPENNAAMRIFGFVARKGPSSGNNQCHLFSELDPQQPATAIVNFVTNVMMSQYGSRQGGL